MVDDLLLKVATLLPFSVDNLSCDICRGLVAGEGDPSGRLCLGLVDVGVRK